jgi:hypothetical protein
MYLNLEYAIHVAVDMSAKMLDNEARTMSANFRKNSERPRGLGDTHWYMKKTCSRESRGRLPLMVIQFAMLLWRDFIYVKTPNEM